MFKCVSFFCKIKAPSSTCKCSYKWCYFHLEHHHLFLILQIIRCFAINMCFIYLTLSNANPRIDPSKKPSLTLDPILEIQIVKDPSNKPSLLTVWKHCYRLNFYIDFFFITKAKEFQKWAFMWRISENFLRPLIKALLELAPFQKYQK